MITIEIVDNGIGMDKEALDNIFNKYYKSGDNSKSSKGLGMSIVKSLIVAHKGDLCVNSEWTKGTTFYITLPILEE